MDLIQFLIKKGILNPEQGIQVKTQVIETGKTQEEIILEKKLLSEQALFKLKSELLAVPFRESLPEEVPYEVMALVPKESAEFYKMIPLGLKKEKGVLEVGMVYPEDPQAHEALRFSARQLKLSPSIFLITLSDFKRYFAKYQPLKEEVKTVIGKLEKEMTLLPKETEKIKLERLIEEAPIIKLVAVILRQGVEGRASDIHIEPTQENIRVRYRLNGILHSSLILPRRAAPALVARIKILSNLKIDETRIPQDGRFSAQIGGRKIDFRVSTFPTVLGEKVAIRILDIEEGLRPLNELGLQSRDLKLIQEAIKKPDGMILITGPTSAGKTSTLYALLRILNKEEKNIVTLEDPVEYFLAGVNQSQIRPDINYTFGRGLRQILRQDPDVIMVGEIRDKETAELAVHAALTGHLMLSTLHTSNVLAVIPRLINLGIQPFLIPPALSFVMSQRLVRTLCPACKQKVKVVGESKKYILETIERLPRNLKSEFEVKEPLFIFQPKGCKKCNFKGYSGRTGIFETLKMDDSLAQIILQHPSEQEILAVARAQGMTTMREDGILKVLQGITSLEELITKVA